MTRARESCIVMHARALAPASEGDIFQQQHSLDVLLLFVLSSFVPSVGRSVGPSGRRIIELARGRERDGRCFSAYC